MEAALVGLPESTVAPSSWWSRNGRLVATAGSGLAWAWVCSWPGWVPARDSMLFSASGWPGLLRPVGRDRRGLALSACHPEPGAAPARHRRPDGAGGPGCDRPGPVGRGGDGRLPVRAVRGAGGAEPGPGPARRSGRCWRSRRRRPSGSAPDGTIRGRAGRPGPRGRPGPGPRGRDDPGRRRRSSRGGRASIRRRSRASRCRWFAGRATTVFAGTVNGEGALEVEAAGPVGDALISRIVAQVRAGAGGPGADRAADRAVRRRVHAGRRGHVAAGHGRARRSPGRLGGRVRTGAWREWFCAGPGRAGDRLPVRPGDRHAGGGGQRPGGGGAARAS